MSHSDSISPKDVAISTITLFELQYGVEKGQYRQRSEDALTEFLLHLNLIELDRPSVVEATIIRAQLEKEGIPIGACNLLIAGLAKSRGMTLVINDTREFEKGPGLNLEN